MPPIASSKAALSSAALGWRLLVVTGVVAFLVVGKLLEREQKPRFREEGERDEAEQGDRGGVNLLGMLGWGGAAEDDDEEDEERAEEGEEMGAAVVAALAGTGSKEEQAQARAWEAAEHEFSVQPEWEKARQLVEIARMRLHSRLARTLEEQRQEQQEQQQQEQAAP